MYNQLLLHEMAEAINRSRRMADAALAGSPPRCYGVAGAKGQTGTSWMVKARAWLGRLLMRDTAPRPEPVINQERRLWPGAATSSAKADEQIQPTRCISHAGVVLRSSYGGVESADSVRSGMIMMVPAVDMQRVLQRTIDGAVADGQEARAARRKSLDSRAQALLGLPAWIASRRRPSRRLNPPS